MAMLHAFIVLKHQEIPPHLVCLWTADEEERRQYENVLLQDPYRSNTELRIGAPGIRDQRNLIVNHYPESTSRSSKGIVVHREPQLGCSLTNGIHDKNLLETY